MASSSAAQREVGMAAEQPINGGLPALVTSFDEHRAALADRKIFRRAEKIDLKLPAATSTMKSTPRSGKILRRRRRGRPSGA